MTWFTGATALLAAALAVQPIETPDPGTLAVARVRPWERSAQNG